MILSFIIPVFDAKPFLEKCVQSLLDQDLERDSYEILLIDDGSTDGSGALCDQLGGQYPMIQVIHQSNQGLSAARNTGLDKARGKYVQFVDSDDWIESRVLSGLVGKMESDHLDVLRFGYRKVNAFGKELARGGQSVSVRTGKDFLRVNLHFTCYACQFLLRKDFLLGHGLYFKRGIIFEDVEWTPRLLEAAGRVSAVDTLVYDYLEREGSITSGKVQRRVEGQFVLIDEMKAQMRQADDKRWYQGMIAHQAIAIISMLAQELYDGRKPYLTRFLEQRILPLSLYQAGKKARRKIALINLSPTLACRLIHLANR